MRYRLFHYILTVCIFCSFGTSCYQKTDSPTIDEVEFAIDEKLVSISKDEFNNIWVGSETGDIFQFQNNQLIHYDLKEDFIYKVAVHKSIYGDSSLWIASRNSGLQIWDIQNQTKLKTYTIDSIKNRYSTYDFLFTSDNHVYVATNMGFYKTQTDRSTNNLTLIYPPNNYLSKEVDDLYIYRNLSLYQDSLILGATLEGIKIYNTKTHKINTFLEGINIEHITNYNDTIFATGRDYLYRISLPNSIIKTSVYNQPKMFFRDRNNNNFLLSREQLMITNDFKHSSNIKLNTKIPSNNNVHNLMVEGYDTNFSLLITENALWRVSSNLNLISGKKVKASCVSEDGCVFYLTGSNELYIHSADQNIANWVFTFDTSDPILWIDVAGETLFLLSSSNTLYKIKLKHEWYKNIIDSPKKIFQTSSKITKPFLYKSKFGDKCLVGTQEGLFYLSNDSVKSIPEFRGVYITSLFKDKESDRLYISSLNDGIYTADFQFEDIEHIANSADISFIKDIIINNNNIIVLTNQSIELIDQDSSSIRLKGGAKLIPFLSNSFFVIPQQGIEKYKINNNKIIKVGDYFKDIRLNPEACFINEGRLILGSDIGTLSTSPINLNGSKWVTFDQVVHIESVSIILLTSLFIIILLISFLRLFYSEKQKGKENQLIKMKEDLLRRMNDIDEFMNEPNIDYSNLTDEIYNIKRYLESLNIEKESDQDKITIKTNLEKLSLQIGDINRKLSIYFWRYLNDQKEQLTSIINPDSIVLIEKINHIEKTDSTRKIYDTIVENQNWLDRYKTILDYLTKHSAILNEIIIIKGVNDSLSNQLEALHILLGSCSINDISHKYNHVKHLVDQIKSKESSGLIRSKINEIRSQIHTITVDEQLLVDLEICYNQTYRDNITSLKLLKELDNQTELSKILFNIKTQSDTFRKSANEINKKNSKSDIKNEQDIYDDIISVNKDVIKSINKLISIFYETLSTQDLDILHNTLKISNTNSQNAKVLALLVADKNIKRTTIPIILGIYGNMNPVISRIINDRIKPNIQNMQSELKSRQSIFIVKILEIIK